jgi:hypothetical protein
LGAPLGVAVPLVLEGDTDEGVVQGLHTNGNYGWLGDLNYGTIGVHNAGPAGVLGGPGFGVYGIYSNNNRGWLGSENYGAYGESASGNYGYLGGSNSGVYGEHANSNEGFLGTSESGVYGQNSNGNVGHLGNEASGVYGENANGHWGRLGGNSAGVRGEHANGHFGILGDNTSGVFGEHTNGNVGRLGAANAAVLGNAAAGSLAGRFLGDVSITGTLSKGGGSFKIDHPLDPEGQYLAHSFVESPDMMNVYNGNVTTDAQGEAVVVLPAYFEALNRNFRYQLTCIGGFAPVYIAEKISGNRFKIAGGTPGMEVSWQVTGIRQDAWAEAHRIVVEQAKPAIERGFYLHPALYGQPAERSVAWARDPEGMRAIQERPAQIEAEHQRMKAKRERIQREQRPPRPRDGQQ